MQVKERGVLSLTPSRFKRALALVFSAGALLFLVLARDLFFYNGKEFQLSYYLWSLALAPALGLLIAFDLHLSKPAQGILSVFLAVISALPMFAMMEAFDVNTIFKVLPYARLFNVLMIWLVCWVLYSVFGRFTVALRVADVLFYIMGLANSAVRIFRGTPISALDLYNIKTAAAVSGRYRYPFEFYFFTATLLMLFVWFLAGKATWRCERRAPRWIARGACLASVLAFGTVFSNTAYLNSIGIKDYLWNQNLAFYDNGLLLSLAYSTKYLNVEVPENYSAQAAQRVIDEADQPDPVAPAAQKPNIIAIMNESFADLAVVGEFETDVDYMPFIRSMAGQPNTITGQLRVSTFGGGTCNTEFEFLTGNTLGFFPSGSVVYQQYIQRQTPSLATVLKGQGYTADAVHPFYGYCWSRDKVYPLLGFDHFYDISDFSGARMIGSYAGNCVSDESDFDKLIELFEAKVPGQPMFLFNVTMQNHGGYAQLINAPDELVHMTKDGYTSKYADNYLSLIKATDTAFAQLIDYFSKVEEPTIILMFGDHEPNLPDGVYEALLGKSLDDLTLEETQKRFTVPFVLWANYDIETQGGDAGLTSANYLSTLLMRTAGLETTPYMDYLAALSGDIPSINLNGYLGADGVEYGYDDRSPYTGLIEEYRTLQYNYLFDKKERLDRLFDWVPPAAADTK